MVKRQPPAVLAEGSHALALQAHSRMTVLLTEAGYPATAAACLEQMRGLPGLSERDAASIATRLQDAKAAAAGRKVSANHYKMLGVLQTCSAEEVRGERSEICVPLAIGNSHQQRPCPSSSAVRLMGRFEPGHRAWRLALTSFKPPPVHRFSNAVKNPAASDNKTQSDQLCQIRY
jgi:hypothetical protein